jgi:hypothetical protein
MKLDLDLYWTLHGKAYFFLGEARADTHDVYHVALYYPNIGQVTTAECVKVLSFPFSQLFLVGQTSLTADKGMIAELGEFNR